MGLAIVYRAEVLGVSGGINLLNIPGFFYHHADLLKTRIGLHGFDARSSS